MKKFILSLVLWSLVPLAHAASAAFPYNPAASGTGAKEAADDLKFGTGRTATFLAGSALTLNASSTLTISGILNATPTSGTVNLASLTSLTIPATVSGGTTSFQPRDATLDAVAGVTTAADKLIYWTGLDTAATTDLSSFGRSLIDDANAAAARTTLGVTATGADTTYLFRANNLSDLANASTARTNLGVAIGTNVQAWDADLDTWATKTAPSGTVVGTSDVQALTNKTINGLTLTASTGTVTIANLKTLTASNTITLTATDGATLAIGGGGTLGTAAYTAATAYEVPLTFSGGLTRTTNTITRDALTGDITASAGSNATTLATVASAGTTGSSTAIPVITINAKGLTTGISTVAVVAPAGTLAGATLASNVLASSLTSLGTLSSLNLGGALTYGGVTLTNAVTGTGKMVLDASPTLTGSPVVGGVTFAGNAATSFNSATSATSTDLTLTGNGGATLTIGAGTNDTYFSSGFGARGAIVLPGSWTGARGLGFSYSGGYSRAFFGDGSGYIFALSKRTGSVTTDVFYADDSGNVTATGTFAAASGAFTQSTLGSAVVSLVSTATNDDPTEVVYQNRAATTDATVTTLHSFTIPANTIVTIEITVTARRTGGSSGTSEDGAGYRRAATLQRIGGTATLIGSVAALWTMESQAGWDCDIDVSSTTARVRVTGAANNNITWHLTARVWSVSS